MPTETITFKKAYGVLQTHAETLRNQTEPNIDDLLQIVEESVNAYRTCKERIDAVEKALEKALTEVGGESQFSQQESRGGAMPARGLAQKSQVSAPPPVVFNDDDSDIPF